MALPHKRVKGAQLIEKKRVAKLWHRFWFGGATVPDDPDTFLLFLALGEVVAIVKDNQREPKEFLKMMIRDYPASMSG